MDQLKELSLLVQQGENVEAVALAEKLLDGSHSVEDVISALSKGVEVLRNKCTIENFQLLDVLLACRAMTEVVDECISKKLQGDNDNMADVYAQAISKSPDGVIVIGTIQGDVHDLGNHVVATLCRFSNFRVINLGKDVPVEKFVTTAIEENADFIGVSSLMTVSMPKIKEIKQELVRRGYEGITVIGGGSAVQQTSCEKLELDYVAQDAFDGLDFFCQQTERIDS